MQQLISWSKNLAVLHFKQILLKLLGESGRHSLLLDVLHFRLRVRPGTVQSKHVSTDTKGAIESVRIKRVMLFQLFKYNRILKT